MERRALLVSHHAKAEVLGPVWAQHGWELAEVDLDTDVLGTFSGDVPRRWPPLETARRKALLGRAHGDAPWLAASEGSVSADPFAPARASEIVVLVARSGEPLIAGFAASEAVEVTSMRVMPDTREEDIAATAQRGLRGGHHLMVSRPDRRRRAIGALAVPDQVLSACCQLGRDAELLVQTDWRAHLCPSRRPLLEGAARDLLARFDTPCPSCGAPGFGPTEAIAGRRCASCERPTNEPRGYRWGCPWCHVVRERRSHDSPVPESRCEWCNP